MSREIAFKSVTGILLLFSATTLWWSVDIVFEHYPLTLSGTIFSLTLFLASLLFYFSLSSLVATFFVKTGIFLCITALTGIPLFLLIPPTVSGIATVAVFILLQTYCFVQLNKRIQLFTKFKIREIYGLFIKSLFIILAALISICFYFFYLPHSPERIILPDRAVETLIEQTFVLFGQGMQLPTEGDPQKSLDWVVQESREENVGERLPKSIISILRGGNTSSEALREFLSEEQADSGPQLGISELRLQVEDELNNVLKPYLAYLPLFFATSLFLTMRFIAPVIVLLGVGFFSGVVWLLKRAGVLIVAEETVQAERLKVNF